MECRDKSYALLCEQIEKNITEVAYKDIAQCKKILVIAVSVENRFKKCIEALLRESDVELIVVAQPSFAEVLEKDWEVKTQIVKWKGKYSLEVLDMIAEISKIEDIDGFLFFSEQESNLRDMNLLEIAEALAVKSNARVFSNSIGDDLCEYKSISLYKQALQVYQDVNILIDLCLSEND